LEDESAPDFRLPQNGHLGQQAEASQDAKPLTADERQLLREGKANGTLAILTRLQKKALHAHIRSASLISEDDPLGKSDAVIEQWAYVKMYRRACAELEALVSAEIGEAHGEANRGTVGESHS
jgi:hypothetical protein